MKSLKELGKSPEEGKEYLYLNWDFDTKPRSYRYNYYLKIEKVIYKLNDINTLSFYKINEYNDLKFAFNSNNYTTGLVYEIIGDEKDCIEELRDMYKTLEINKNNDFYLNLKNKLKKHLV